MKIDFSQVLKDLDGSPALDNGKKVTLGKVVANSLIGIRQDRNTDAVKCYVMATKVYSAGAIDIDQADLEMLKEEVKKGPYGPLVIGQAIIMLTSVLENPVKSSTNTPGTRISKPSAKKK